MVADEQIDAPSDRLPQSEMRLDIHVVRSTDLFGGRKEIFIDHGGQLYRLRITRADKLILQK